MMCDDIIDEAEMDTDQKGVSPELRATWLSRRRKKVPFLGIFCLFACVWGGKRAGEKPALNPGTRVSLVKVLTKQIHNVDE